MSDPNYEVRAVETDGETGKCLLKGTLAECRAYCRSIDKSRYYDLAIFRDGMTLIDAFRLFGKDLPLLRLRAYRDEDAEEIARWTESEEELYLWSAGRFGKWPLYAGSIQEYYAAQRKTGRFIPLTAVNEAGTVLGHLIIRYPQEDDDTSVRFGFIIVSPSLRGRGYGAELVLLAADYVRAHLPASRIELGVFENNRPAKHCYESIGFRTCGRHETVLPVGTWICEEMELLLS